MHPTPWLISTQVTVGPLPDMILPNGACTILAVANEGEGKQDDAGVLVDPVGSVDLVDLATYAVSRVDFAGLAATDADLAAKGVDQLMSLASMTYFNDHSYIKDDLDWDAAIAAYTPATQLEPEYLAWSGDDATVYVNLQENSAVVAVDASTATAADVFGLGLKSWAATKIDTVKDGECILETKPGFATMRMPDSIAAFTLDGKDYLLFAEEGDDYTYGDFEDKQKFKDVVKNATAFEDDFADFVAGAGMADAFANFGDTNRPPGRGLQRPGRARLRGRRRLRRPRHLHLRGVAHGPDLGLGLGLRVRGERVPVLPVGLQRHPGRGVRPDPRAGRLPVQLAARRRRPHRDARRAQHPVAVHGGDGSRGRLL